MKRKILYIAFAPIIKGNGVANKILSQRDAFEKLGNEVSFCYFKKEKGIQFAYINDASFYCLGGRLKYQFSVFFFFKKLSRFVKEQKFDIVYIRYEKNANAALISFLKTLKGNCVRLLEVPTFPYDGEILNPSLYLQMRLWEEKYFRKKFSDCLERIVTFSDDTSIFGVDTIKISNAVDDVSINLRIVKDDPDWDISLIGVANLAFWHGYDRVIYGLYNYYQSKGEKKILFRIIGEGNKNEQLRLKEIVRSLSLEKNVLFYKNMSGKDLDGLFDLSDFAVGCLGCHRKNIYNVKSLKNVEYAMRGIPFIFSERNDDFDLMPYVLKVDMSDTPINIEEIINFVNCCSTKPWEIRKSVMHLTWEHQMRIVLNNLAGISF